MDSPQKAAHAVRSCGTRRKADGPVRLLRNADYCSETGNKLKNPVSYVLTLPSSIEPEPNGVGLTGYPPKFVISAGEEE